MRRPLAWASPRAVRPLRRAAVLLAGPSGSRVARISSVREVRCLESLRAERLGVGRQLVSLGRVGEPSLAYFGANRSAPHRQRLHSASGARIGRHRSSIPRTRVSEDLAVAWVPAPMPTGHVDGSVISLPTTGRALLRSRGEHPAGPRPWHRDETEHGRFPACT